MNRVLVVLAAVAALAACSSSGDSGSTGGNGSGSNGGSSGSSACNTVALSGSTVTAVAVASGAPAAGGGTIADGTYVLTSLKLYTGAGGQSGTLAGQTEQETAVISGSTVQRHYDYRLLGDASAGQETDTYVVSGSTFDGSATCPEDGIPLTGTYTATATALTLYSSGAAGTAEAIYTKQ